MSALRHLVDIALFGGEAQNRYEPTLRRVILSRLAHHQFIHLFRFLRKASGDMPLQRAKAREKVLCSE